MVEDGKFGQSELGTASLYIRPQSAFGADQGRVSVVIGSKPAFEKPVEGVALDVRLPSRVASADPTATHGQCTYDITSNERALGD